MYEQYEIIPNIKNIPIRKDDKCQGFLELLEHLHVKCCIVETWKHPGLINRDEKRRNIFLIVVQDVQVFITCFSTF